MNKKEQVDSECICKGNWRLIIKESEPTLGKRYKDKINGEEYIFFGVVHSADDYYYGMWNIKTEKNVLLSCVSSIEGHGYILVKY